MEALWRDSAPVTEDAEAAAWLRSRDLDPQAVQHWDLARALPGSGPLPRWTRCAEGTWRETGHRILLRAWNTCGRFASIRARAVRLPEPAKSLAPCGFSTAGLVLADPLGVQLLAEGPPRWWRRLEVVISEGDPDFLMRASSQPEYIPEGPAHFGIVAGSWSAALASRIPDGSRVALWTHQDSAGDRYAAEIVATLSGRCKLYRKRGEAQV
ncbi:MAG: hypothetical protein EYC70_15235 [Planctomycetota bacterium]|nr:MAG: hypothetical protein EYC70_15235 [Planctomycetota bacterium]